MDANLAGVIVAAIGLAGIWLNNRRINAAKKHTAEVAETVGVKNGSGTIAEMSERILDIALQSQKWQVNHDQRDDRRFQALDERVGRLEDSN